MARLLANWLYSYRDWTVSRSEAKESLIIWSGLFALASAARRHVRFPRRLMGSYNIYPNLYIIFIGPAGAVRKSTTAGYSETLLRQIDGVNLSSTGMSASKLIETLAQFPDGSISIISSELSSFMAVSKEDMYDLLTDLYDGKVDFEYATRMHGVELVETPCVNFFACTTPDWAESRMPTYVLGGGFASRVIFVCEFTARQRKLYFDEEWEKLDYNRLEKSLVQDLAHIASIEGDFRHDNDETKGAIESWYQEQADEEVENNKLAGYAARRHVHLHKVAMLLSLAERDDMIVTMEHFEAALAILTGTEKNLSTVFQSSGKNPIASAIHVVLEYIRKKDGPVSFNQCLSYFYQDISADMLREVLATLVTIGALVRMENPSTQGDPLYKLVSSSPTQ